MNEPQGLTREDLRSPEPEVSQGSHRSASGWESGVVEGAEDHTTARSGELFPLGGLGPVRPRRSTGRLPHLGVADARAATAAGGSLADRVEDAPFGLLTEVIDPWGARFAVIQQPDDAPRPDRSP